MNFWVLAVSDIVGTEELCQDDWYACFTSSMVIRSISLDLIHHFVRSRDRIILSQGNAR